MKIPNVSVFMNSSKDIFINRVAFSFITNIQICFIFGRALSFGTRLCFFLDVVFLALLSLCVQRYQEHRFHLSVGPWKVGEERSNTCGRNPRHTPYGTGTLLTLLAMTAWAPCSSSRDGQQACGRHSYGFRMDCPCCDSLGEKSPCSFFFCYMRRYGMYGIYTPS